MTGTGACAEIRLELGVYLVGAIGAADRSAVHSHLASCADCRNVVAELAGLPGLLHRVTADDADSSGCRGGAGAVAAAERCKTSPNRARRPTMTKPSGE
jgi:predicted anti-sigma-YlaC factor YlaD